MTRCLELSLLPPSSEEKTGAGDQANDHVDMTKPPEKNVKYGVRELPGWWTQVGPGSIQTSPSVFLHLVLPLYPFSYPQLQNAQGNVFPWFLWAILENRWTEEGTVGISVYRQQVRHSGNHLELAIGIWSESRLWEGALHLWDVPLNVSSEPELSWTVAHPAGVGALVTLGEDPHICSQKVLCEEERRNTRIFSSQLLMMQGTGCLYSCGMCGVLGCTKCWEPLLPQLGVSMEVASLGTIHVWRWLWAGAGCSSEDT